MLYGPDSTEQVTIQAAEHLLRFGAPVPFSVSSPLMPALVAVVAGVTGLGAEQAYLVVAVLAYLVGSLCLYWIVRRFQPSSATPLWGPLTYAVAPSRVSCLYGQPDGPRLLFWTLILASALAADGLRRGFSPSRLALLVCSVVLLIGTMPGSVTDLDFLAVLELAVLLGITYWKRVQRIGLGKFNLANSNSVKLGLVKLSLLQLTCTALFVVPSLWSFAIYPSLVYQPPAMPEAAVAWVRANSAASTVPRVHGPVSAQALLQPNREAIDRMVQSPGRTKESLLWLRVHAVEYLISMDWEKFHPVLECVQQEGEWCVYRIPYPNPARAVLVSRQLWRDLKPIRGPHDVEGLEAYVSWAGRPETIVLDWHDSTSAEIRADLGPADAILVREFALPGWEAVVLGPSGGQTPVQVQQDPAGFILLDPKTAGPTVVQLKYNPEWLDRVIPPSLTRDPFIEGDFPVISTDGIADAFDYTPAPFKLGAVLTIFGRDFVADQTSVFVAGEETKPSYVGSNQINVQLPLSTTPGTIDIVVQSDGRQSYPYSVEVIR
jgi:hypothetical protein